jgi:hypothetical protein
MTEPSDDRDPTPGTEQATAVPRWVKLLGVVLLLLVLLIAVLHLTGNSLGGPGSHLGVAGPDLLP